MKNKTEPNAHRGSDFNAFFAEEGLLADVEVLALKRVVALQIQQALD